jgi:LIVCS family branched-chain amino acid:cation transporter
MKKELSDILIIGFALFSSFFGAGNVIFPPYLGLESGSNWLLSFILYYIADIGLALVAIFAMIRTRSDVDGIMGRLGKTPGKVFTSIIVLCIGPLVAVPRTAATTYEMTIVPITGMSGNMISIITIVAYFALILALCIKESSVVDIVGKYLTPTLFVGLLILIIKGIVSPIGTIADVQLENSLIVNSVTTGYQTMDVLAALIFGVMIVKSATEKGYTEINQKNKVIGWSSIVAGIGLLIVYGGLSYLGATASLIYPMEINRSVLIISIIEAILGQLGIVILGIVVALACITTAVALVGASGTYFARLSNGKLNYKTIVIVICILSAAIATMGLDEIIAVASPILNVVYPAALTVIVLSLFGNNIKNDNIFKGSALGALVASFIETLAAQGLGMDFIYNLPLSQYGFGWVLPAIICGLIGALIKSGKNDYNTKEISSESN